ncbi:hypothetical protein TNCV_3874621, partial [Trichonephila clavipes]
MSLISSPAIEELPENQKYRHFETASSNGRNYRPPVRLKLASNAM